MSSAPKFPPGFKPKVCKICAGNHAPLGISGENYCSPCATEAGLWERSVQTTSVIADEDAIKRREQWLVARYADPGGIDLCTECEGDAKDAPVLPHLTGSTKPGWKHLWLHAACHEAAIAEWE